MNNKRHKKIKKKETKKSQEIDNPEEGNDDADSGDNEKYPPEYLTDDEDSFDELLRDTDLDIDIDLDIDEDLDFIDDEDDYY